MDELTRRPRQGLLESPWVRALTALLLILVLGALFNAGGAFFEWGTHRDMLRQISVIGILSCGMTLVIITGGIDLSVGSLLGLSAVLFALLSLRLSWPPFLAAGACVAAGIACGTLSGAAVARFKIQPFIATLAMMVAARGFAKSISGGEKVSRAVLQPDGSYVYADLPRFFEMLDHRVLRGNLAVVTLIFLGCVLVCWILLARLRWGRYLYAVGANEEAARLSGVPAGPVKLLAYGLSGAFAAVAGICQAVQEQQGDPEAGAAYELSAIAMVVIGGTSLSGGRGRIAFTLLGTLTIGYLEKILSVNAVSEAGRLVLTGIIIIAAVLLQKESR
jgi:ribose/xylose/arabinose/galactoside ABC-type transport system permease subunit